MIEPACASWLRGGGQYCSHFAQIILELFPLWRQHYRAVPEGGCCSGMVGARANPLRVPVFRVPELQLIDGHDIELWQGDRQIAKFANSRISPETKTCACRKLAGGLMRWGRSIAMVAPRP